MALFFLAGVKLHFIDFRRLNHTYFQCPCGSGSPTVQTLVVPGLPFPVDEYACLSKKSLGVVKILGINQRAFVTSPLLSCCELGCSIQMPMHHPHTLRQVRQPEP
jgi:hypothetical protein